MFKKILFALMLLPIIAFADCSKEAYIKGEKLLNRLWKDMKECHIKAIKNYSSKHFQSIHRDGVRNLWQELNLIKNLHIAEYTLSNISISKEHNVFIITYVATVLKDGEEMPIRANRMTTFEKVDGHWKWTSHANFERLL